MVERELEARLSSSIQASGLVINKSNSPFEGPSFPLMLASRRERAPEGRLKSREQQANRARPAHSSGRRLAARHPFQMDGHQLSERRDNGRPIDDT